MDWMHLESEMDLKKAIETSFQEGKNIAIFKHSTRCSISSVAKQRLTSFWNFKDDLPIYYLDLIAFRDLSSLISDKFDIQHESPQLLIIKEGKCIFSSSHLSISVKSIHKALEA